MKGSSAFVRMRRELGMDRRDWTPLRARRCFVCGSYKACCHREPELLIRKGDGDSVNNNTTNNNAEHSA